MASVTLLDRALRADVIEGLSRRQKMFPSKHCHYFYDETGSRLFEQITCEPGYYLTGCEESILAAHGPAIVRRVSDGFPLRLVELGVGDGHKTLSLLESCAGWCECEYVPSDICSQVIEQVAHNVSDRLGDSSVTVAGRQGEHYAVIDWLREQPRPPRTAVLFLGSNIGNYSAREAQRFLTHLRGSLRPGDWLVLGVDQKPHAGKPASVVEGAYRDSTTQRFTLHLLERFNDELGADFEIDAFSHHACYRRGRIETSLIGQRQQFITLADRSFEFEAGEEYFVERSEKFNRFDVERLAGCTGFTAAGYFPCRRDWFLVCLLRAI